MDGLSLTDLSKRYGDHTVVDRLSLAMRPGEFVSLLGPSGCGKTTTLRMIAGFVRPTAGRIAAAGRLLSSEAGCLPPERRGMSMIFQSYALWPHMTVAQNAGFGLAMRGVGRAERRRRVGEILEAVQLGHLAGRYPNQLSGGQQQRVSLARALVVKPDILLLDEPLSNLDAALRESMRREIRRLHDAFGTTSIYVTHDQGEAMATSDRIAIMHDGRIAQIADPQTLHARPATRSVATFLGCRNILDGVRRDGMIAFPGFSVPAGRLDDGSPAAGTAFCVHAGSLSLSPDPPGGDAPAVAGRLVERAFLGETWDYVFQADGSALRLRVTAPAGQALEAGERVFVSIPPSAFVGLRDDA